MLVDQRLTSVLLRQSPNDTAVSRTFDYSDLTAFLLMVLGVTDPSHSSMSNTSFQDLVKKAREGDQIPVKLVGDIGIKDPFITYPETEHLARVVEKMASGVHRIAVTREGTNEVIGVLSQRKVIKFFWENIRSFVDLEPTYQKTVSSFAQTSLMVDRGIGNRVVECHHYSSGPACSYCFGNHEFKRNFLHRSRRFTKWISRQHFNCRCTICRTNLFSTSHSFNMCTLPLRY